MAGSSGLRPVLLFTGAIVVAVALVRVPGRPPAGLSRSAPVRVRVARLHVSARVVPVGARTDGGIGSPPLSRAALAGWYDEGPSPGEPGRAVIVGHYDSRTGPAVFYRLPGVRPGDRIDVSRADASVARFTVDSVQRVAKERFPAGRVLGRSRTSELRLITCTGPFDRRIRSYVQNLIVYAHLVDGRP